MLKELYIAMKMVKAARDLQAELGQLKSIYVKVEEEKTRMSVHGEDYYVFFDPMKPTGYESMAEDAITIWNYCNCNFADRIEHMEWSDADGSYTEDTMKVGNMWLIYLDCR